MICPNCKQETTPALFCHACDAYLANPAMGAKASVARRFGAPVLDIVVIWVLFFVVLLVSAGIGSSIGSNEEGFGAFFSSFFWAAVAYTVFALWFLARGKTPGKWLVGIRAADKRNGSLPGLGRMLVRETIGKFLSGLVLGLGYLWAIFDKDAQAWHDKIAGTVVLRQTVPAVSSAGIPEPISPSMKPAAAGVSTSVLPVSATSAIASTPVTVAAARSRFCSQCGTAAESGSKFCMSCGASLPPDRSAPTTVKMSTPSLAQSDVSSAKVNLEPSSQPRRALSAKVIGPAIAGILLVLVAATWLVWGVEVDVVTDPAGAEILLDGKPVDRISNPGNPLILPHLAHGKHTLLVDHPGFRSLTIPISLGWFEVSQNVLAKLSVPSFPLMVFTNPGGAKVQVDGREVGLSDEAGNLVVQDVPSGQHVVTVTREGYPSWSNSFWIQSPFTVRAYLAAAAAGLTTRGTQSAFPSPNGSPGNLPQPTPLLTTPPTFTLACGAEDIQLCDIVPVGIKIIPTTTCDSTILIKRPPYSSRFMVHLPTFQGIDIIPCFEDGSCQELFNLQPGSETDIEKPIMAFRFRNKNSFPIEGTIDIR